MKTIRAAAAAITLVLGLGLAGPALAQAEKILRIVPQADLRVLDPVWTTAQVTQNHAYMVYDVLFAIDSKFEPRPQMVDTWTRSDDGMTWTFRLREGMRFHDGSPVRAADAVASIRRWAARSAPGGAMMQRAESLEAIDDLGFRLVFKRKFGPVLEVLGTPSLPPFVMRESDAATDPFKQVAEVVGSGPFVFSKAEHRPGTRVVYRRFADYKSRPEPADGYAGGKVAKVDRVDWINMPDVSTAAAALRTGEIDYVEYLPFDHIPEMERDKGVVVRILNGIGLLGHIRPNALQPPFDDPRARRALNLLVDQKTFLKALGAEGTYARECFAVFVCGGPFETDFATAPWARQDKARARQLLAEAGYKGEPIVILDPGDQPVISTIANVTAGLLREIGATVDLQTMDWSAKITRRNSKDRAGPRSQGWHLAFTWWTGIAMSNPMTNVPLVTTCDGKNLYGWPCDEQIEKLREEFIEASGKAEQMEVIEKLQARFYEVVPYVNTGLFFQPAAYSARLRGVPATLTLVAWNVEKP
jgi:peptide/nickel transport system substrate-binding protein